MEAFVLGFEDSLRLRLILGCKSYLDYGLLYEVLMRIVVVGLGLGLGIVLVFEICRMLVLWLLGHLDIWFSWGWSSMIFNLLIKFFNLLMRIISIKISLVILTIIILKHLYLSLLLSQDLDKVNLIISIRTIIFFFFKISLIFKMELIVYYILLMKWRCIIVDI